MAHQFLVHAAGDSVGVAVVDIPAGTQATGVTLREQRRYAVTVREPVPLGHKVALTAIRRGEKVIEYGEVIGQATADIAPGEHVHVHNLTSVRWPKSQATESRRA